MSRPNSFPFGDEWELIDRIGKASAEDDRDRLISELEKLPVRYRPFYDRWLAIHDVDPFHQCWTENGYDPSLSEIPRNIQLLAAASYGKSDIDNGGFHQFFSNWTGTMAPEMIEWFQRSGLAESADVVREAVAVFGTKFPRSQSTRQEFLARFKGTNREEWDPFYAMDGRFDATLSRQNDKGIDEKRFDDAADRWLRNVCQIRSLHDRLPAKPKPPGGTP